MKIAFYKAKKSFIDKTICFFTNGPYSHAELIFDDGISFSSSLPDHGVRFKHITYNVQSWDFIVVNLSPENEHKVRDFCEKQQGKKYDLLGVLGFVMPLQQEKKKWFCSEIIIRALQEAGLYRWVIPSRIHPTALHDLLRSQNVPPQAHQ